MEPCRNNECVRRLVVLDFRNRSYAEALPAADRNPAPAGAHEQAVHDVRFVFRNARLPQRYKPSGIRVDDPPLPRSSAICATLRAVINPRAPKKAPGVDNWLPRRLPAQERIGVIG